MAEKPATLDVERVICRVSDLDATGSRAFTMGAGPWQLRGFVVRVRDQVRAYVNRCPHANHPLNLQPHKFLTSDSALILCNSHGALFEKDTGYCVAGPCAGQSLRTLPIAIDGSYVVLGDDPARYAED
jgi:nitrite reductase/ring-hydroxylating ferredoxin subunit